MNYNDWVEAFKNRTPEHLANLINAIDILQDDVDIHREYDSYGLFGGFSLRNAANEALREKEEQFLKAIARRVYTMAIVRITEEYPQISPTIITSSMTLHKVLEWIKDIKTNDSILDAAGAIIDAVIDDTHFYYSDLKSKFVDADELERSILYGESYYSLEDEIVNILTTARENKTLVLPTDDKNISTTRYFWNCECKDKFIRPKSVDQCIACGTARVDSPYSRTSEVVSAKLKGEI